MSVLKIKFKANTAQNDATHAPMMISFFIMLIILQSVNAQTNTLPAFQHGPRLDMPLCRFVVESAYLSSVEAKLVRQNCPLKTKLAGNLLQCLQVNYSILKTSASIKYLS